MLHYILLEIKIYTECTQRAIADTDTIITTVISEETFSVRQSTRVGALWRAPKT